MKNAEEFFAIYCGPCNRAYQRERQKERQVLHTGYIRQLRAKVVAAYGGKCACCGETEPMFLEIDHIFGGGTQQRREMEMAKFYRWLRDEHPEGFQVLCSNCNRGRWRNKGICPHQMQREAIAC